ncbi:hypothetical protein D3C78_1873150 [compost metagenome]
MRDLSIEISGNQIFAAGFKIALFGGLNHQGFFLIFFAAFCRSGQRALAYRTDGQRQ